MQTATLIIAVLGVLLSALSLGWQRATFVLSGGRVKVHLIIGAMHPSGSGLMSITDVEKTPAHELPQRIAEFRRHGYTRPVIGVEVINIGRMPVTIAKWEVATTAKVSLRPMAGSVGPSLPFELGAGKSETWLADLSEVLTAVDTGAEVFKLDRASVTVKGVVTLSTRESHSTPYSIRV